MNSLSGWGLRWVLRCAVAAVVLSAVAGIGHAQTLVINELDYDQPGTDASEFIEIKNVSAGDINLDGFVLQFVNGSGGGAVPYDTVALPDVVVPAGGFFVVCGDIANVPNCDLDSSPNTNWLQNGAPDAVALLDPVAAIVDTVSYEGDVPGFTETAGALADLGADEDVFLSISRTPDGSDSDDNSADFALVCATPGLANSTAIADCACGDGVVEAGEQCDDGIGTNGTAASCCDATCNFVAAATACGDGTDDECANPDTCDGAGACQTNDELDGTGCTDDGNECTGDVCAAGVCDHPALGAGATCGDGTDDDCLNPDTCDGAGVCVSNDEVDGVGCTDDGNDCTANVCASGACVHPVLSAGTTCGDGTDDDCLNADTCDGAGACQANDEADGTACTDDGVECTSDVCTGGACAHPPILEGDACTDDGNDCTGDVCLSGVCEHPVLGVGTSCGDGTNDDCLNPDTCDGAGVCQANDEADGTACTDDGNDCTTDTCATGACAHPPAAAGTACGDSADADCSDPDTCNAAGVCQSNDAANGTACTDDGLFCTGAETCISGVCEGEGDPCTGPMQSCSEADDSCAVPPCGDGVVAGEEECDDDNDTAGDGCTDCTVDDGFVCDDSEPSVCTDSCGNGTLDAGEGCEDGNTSDGDGCDGSCSVEDGFECVGNSGTGLDECAAVCGDGILVSDEDCDDGNTSGGDGCAAGCTVESGYTCQLEPSVCRLVDAREDGCSCRVGDRRRRTGSGVLWLVLGALVLGWRRRAGR